MRGTHQNPFNRFTTGGWEYDDDIPPDERPDPKTTLIIDHSATIIAKNDSPDVFFDASLNPYRGCEHGCVYCYARPTHEYLGFSAGKDFESKILFKPDAALLLRQELSSKGWKPRLLQMSGVTDPYQPVERSLRITRSLLEVLAECRNPVSIITKNFLVTRDIDIFLELNRYHCIQVTLSITTLEPELTSILEPRTSRPSRRLEAIKRLNDAGVPVGVLVAPIIPGLNEHEVPAILEKSAEAGAQFAGYTLLRLPYVLKDLFSEWLQEHRPTHKEKILNRIRSIRGGKLNNTNFGERFRGEGPVAEQIRDLFRIQSQKHGLSKNRREMSTAHFRRPQTNGQLSMF